MDSWLFLFFPCTVPFTSSSFPGVSKRSVWDGWHGILIPRDRTGLALCLTGYGWWMPVFPEVGSMIDFDWAGRSLQGFRKI